MFNLVTFLRVVTSITPLNPAGQKTGLTEKPYRPKKLVNWPLGLLSVSWCTGQQIIKVGLTLLALLGYLL